MKKFIFPLLFLLLSCSFEEQISSNADWSFIIIGDNRSGYDTYSKFVTLINSTTPTPLFTVVLGDMISVPGNELEWGQFIQDSKPLTDKMDFYTIIGNHDVDSIETENIYRKYNNLPNYYIFKHRNFAFIALNSEEIGEVGYIISTQLSWLKDQLESLSLDSTVDHIGIFSHRPLFADNDRNLKNRDELHQLFKSYSKVNFVAAGHNHHFSYQKIDNINYIVTGGGGAELLEDEGGSYFHYVNFNITSENLNINTTNIYGEVIESYNF